MAWIGSRQVNAEAEMRALAREQEAAGQRAAARQGDLLKANDAVDVGNRLRRVAMPSSSMAAAAEAAGVPLQAVQDLARERIMGANDMVSVAYLELAMAAARSVCRVRLRRPGRPDIGSGTGFLVAPGMLLTNHHVLPDAATAATALAQFDFQDDCDGQPLAPADFALEPARFFVADARLDWALVAVAPVAQDGVALEAYGWLPLIGELGKAANAEFLNIVQHPEGGPKQMALRENRLVDRLPEHLHYESDTAPGSSGAPVFNDQWEVVALHHAAYPRIVDGKVMALGGIPWDRATMGEDRIDWVGNEGIRASVLVREFRRLRPAGAERRRLLDAVLGAPRAPWPPFPRRGTLPHGREVARAPGGGTAPGPEMAPDGSVTWTLPLAVTIRLGAPAARGEPAAPPPKPAVQTAPAPSPEVPEEAPDPAVEAEVAAVLELHRAAGALPYHDEAADAAGRTRYYDGIDLGAADATALRAALSRRLEQTHRPRRYDPMRLVYPRLDKRRDGTLRSIYSGQPFTAEEIVRADLGVDRQRALAREALPRAQAGSGGFEEALDLLEASLPYNCEHVVPQSWFARREPERGDLHHLFTCESRCNSFRGNTPYWDFPDFEEVVRSQCGKLVGERFEPSAGKGAVARATLYFMLRYPGRIDGRYDAARMAMLLAWHAAKPVDEWERHRNAVAEELQGNRNPFIDAPELAARLFGQGHAAAPG